MPSDKGGKPGRPSAAGVPMAGRSDPAGHRLLAGEAEAGADDAAKWAAVYRELLDFKLRLLSRGKDYTASLSEVAAEEAMTDMKMMKREASRYRRRLAYWLRVQAEGHLPQ